MNEFYIGFAAGAVVAVLGCLWGVNSALNNILGKR